MSENNSVVAVYDSHEQASDAVRRLSESGIDVRKISILGKDYHSDEQITGYYNAGDRMKYWGALGAFWGSIWGLLFGSALFVVPGIGPILVAGPLVGSIVAALEGAAVVAGLSVVGAGLYSIGIPKDSILMYEMAIRVGKFLVIVHGTPDEVSKARNSLKPTGTSEFGGNPGAASPNLETEVAGSIQIAS